MMTCSYDLSVAVATLIQAHPIQHRSNALQAVMKFPALFSFGSLVEGWMLVSQHQPLPHVSMRTWTWGQMSDGATIVDPTIPFIGQMGSRPWYIPARSYARTLLEESSFLWRLPDPLPLEHAYLRAYELALALSEHRGLHSYHVPLSASRMDGSRQVACAERMVLMVTPRRVLFCCPHCQCFWATQGTQISISMKEELSRQEKALALTSPEAPCAVCEGKVLEEAYGGGDAGYGWYWSRTRNEAPPRKVFQASFVLHFIDLNWSLVPLRPETIENPEHYQWVVGWLAKRPKLSAHTPLSEEDLSSLSQCYPVPQSAKTTIWQWKGIACSSEHPQFGQMVMQMAWMIPEREILDHRLITRFWRCVLQRLASNHFGEKKGTPS